MQEIINVNNQSPATAALAALNDATLQEASRIGKSVKQSLDLTSMFRSVLTSEDPSFDFPDIVWSDDDNNDNQPSETSALSSLVDLPQSPVYTVDEAKCGERRKRSEDLYDECNSLKNMIRPLRRAKTLRTDLSLVESSFDGSMSGTNFVSNIYKSKSDGNILRERCFDTDRRRKYDNVMQSNPSSYLDMTANNTVVLGLTELLSCSKGKDCSCLNCLLQNAQSLCTYSPGLNPSSDLTKALTVRAGF